MIFLCQSHINGFVNYMSTKHTNIKFTSEFKINDSFSFLDVKTTPSNNQLVTSVFHKVTFGAFTNFKSYTCRIQVWLSLHFTASFIFYLFFIEKFHEEIVLLKDIFKKNEHSEFFIDKMYEKFFKQVVCS